MNALVGIRSNSGGYFSATPEKRLAVRQETLSMARAALLGRAKAIAEAKGLTTPETQAIAKSAGNGSAAVAKSNSSEDSNDDPMSRAVNKDLDKDTFLQLLVNQMQNQDPLNPTDNTQMIAQLAQFSSLEQMSNMNDQLETVRGNINQINFASANALIGRTIAGLNEDGDTVRGAVSGVYMDNSTVYLSVGEELVPMSNLIGVVSTPPESDAS